MQIAKVAWQPLHLCGWYTISTKYNYSLSYFQTLKALATYAY